LTTRNEKDVLEMEKLREKTAELSVTVENMEKERNYYYEKLRKIELLCQQTELTPFVQSIQDIMYDDEN
jgi:microtubule-associated protein, RP/EB family